MKELLEIMQFAFDGLNNSKDGLTTYEDDSQADHGDGQQVRREAAYRNIIRKCAAMIAEKI